MKSAKTKPNTKLIKIVYKHLSEKYMENWIPNNQKTFTGEGFDADKEKNGNGEEHKDVDYYNDDNGTSSSFGDKRVATAMLTTTTTIRIQSKWWRLEFRIVRGFNVLNSSKNKN